MVLPRRALVWSASALFMVAGLAYGLDLLASRDGGAGWPAAASLARVAVGLAAGAWLLGMRRVAGAPATRP